MSLDDHDRANQSSDGLEEVALKEFVSTVGARVRQVRLQKALSRRVLSEKSGVSQRYLAQLEAGGGNISIAVLHKIAQSLGRDPSWFLAKNAQDDEADLLLQQLQLVGADVRDRVRKILFATSTAETKGQRICLIGLRGAGKSTLGSLLAEKIGFNFIELNSAIEQDSGMPVPEIMALYGQEGYRELERKAINRVISETQRTVLAVGGGIVSEPDTFNSVLRSFHTVWLKTSPEEHMQRVRDQGDERPMAGNSRAMDELKSILTSREMLYARADLMIDTSNNTPAESLVKLHKALLQDLELNLDV